MKVSLKKVSGMASPKIEKFIRAQESFQCPLCGGALEYANGSLRCNEGHTFDVSSKGYVNFVPNQKPSKEYDRAFFENRRLFLNAGYYDHVRDAVQEIVEASGAQRVADAGCGEGFYAKYLSDNGCAHVYGLDLAKDAIQIAAKGANSVCWLVADVAKMPLAPSSVDCVLDVFTPANYAEFDRVLAPGGMVVKVVPGSGHLHRLRRAVRGHVAHEEYENTNVVEYFGKHFRVAQRRMVSKTLPIEPEHLGMLFSMTPLLFGVEQRVLDSLDLAHVTIEAEILVGVRP